METQVVNLLLKMFPAAGQIVPNGDDCAVLRTSPRTAITVDTHVEGVHFQWAWAKPQELGARFVGVVLSDLAAMGARPQYGVLSLLLPKKFAVNTVRRFAEGMAARAKAEGFSIVGGDVANGTSFSAVLTALGAAPKKPLRRTARRGDLLCVSGPLGGAGADLRRLMGGESFSPSRWLCPPSRLALGRRLAQSPGVHGAMDISDGLFLDARRLGSAAGLGVEIDASAIPLDHRLAAWGTPGSAPGGAKAWLAAVGGGEDYELLVAVKPGHIPAGLIPVGRFVSSGYTVLWQEKRFPWPKVGHLHS